MGGELNKKAQATARALSASFHYSIFIGLSTKLQTEYSAIFRELFKNGPLPGLQQEAMQDLSGKGCPD